MDVGEPTTPRVLLRVGVLAAPDRVGVRVPAPDRVGVRVTAADLVDVPDDLGVRDGDTRTHAPQVEGV